jgi:hypothetical protein
MLRSIILAATVTLCQAEWKNNWTVNSHTASNSGQSTLKAETEESKEVAKRLYSPGETLSLSVTSIRKEFGDLPKIDDPPFSKFDWC